MKDNGVVDEYPEPADYITDKYMQNIANDPILSKYARGEDVDLTCLDTDCNSAAPRVTGVALAVASLFVGFWF